MAAASPSTHPTQAPPLTPLASMTLEDIMKTTSQTDKEHLHSTLLKLLKATSPDKEDTSSRRPMYTSESTKEVAVDRFVESSGDIRASGSSQNHHSEYHRSQSYPELSSLLSSPESKGSLDDDDEDDFLDRSVKVKNMTTRELNRWRLTLFTVYVGRLPFDITKRELAKLGQQIGSVQDVHLQGCEGVNGYTFGFLRYLTLQEAEEAVAMLNGRVLGNRHITVQLSQETRRLIAAGRGVETDDFPTDRGDKLLRKGYPEVRRAPPIDADEEAVQQKLRQSISKLKRSCEQDADSGGTVLKKLEDILKKVREMSSETSITTSGDEGPICPFHGMMKRYPNTPQQVVESNTPQYTPNEDKQQGEYPVTPSSPQEAAMVTWQMGASNSPSGAQTFANHDPQYSAAPQESPNVKDTRANDNPPPASHPQSESPRHPEVHSNIGGNMQKSPGYSYQSQVSPVQTSTNGNHSFGPNVGFPVQELPEVKARISDAMSSPIAPQASPKGLDTITCQALPPASSPQTVPPRYPSDGHSYTGGSMQKSPGHNIPSQASETLLEASTSRYHSFAPNVVTSTLPVHELPLNETHTRSSDIMPPVMQRSPIAPHVHNVVPSTMSVQELPPIEVQARGADAIPSAIQRPPVAQHESPKVLDIRTNQDLPPASSPQSVPPRYASDVYPNAVDRMQGYSAPSLQTPCHTSTDGHHSFVPYASPPSQELSSEVQIGSSDVMSSVTHSSPVAHAAVAHPSHTFPVRNTELLPHQVTPTSPKSRIVMAANFGAKAPISKPDGNTNQPGVGEGNLAYSRTNHPVGFHASKGPTGHNGPSNTYVSSLQSSTNAGEGTVPLDATNKHCQFCHEERGNCSHSRHGGAYHCQVNDSQNNTAANRGSERSNPSLDYSRDMGLSEFDVPNPTMEQAGVKTTGPVVQNVKNIPEEDIRVKSPTSPISPSGPVGIGRGVRRVLDHGVGNNTIYSAGRGRAGYMTGNTSSASHKYRPISPQTRGSKPASPGSHQGPRSPVYTSSSQQNTSVTSKQEPGRVSPGTTLKQGRFSPTNPQGMAFGRGQGTRRSPGSAQGNNGRQQKSHINGTHVARKSPVKSGNPQSSVPSQGNPGQVNKTQTSPSVGIKRAELLLQNVTSGANGKKSDQASNLPAGRGFTRPENNAGAGDLPQGNGINVNTIHSAMPSGSPLSGAPFQGTPIQGAPFPPLPPGMGASLQGAPFPPQIPGMGASPLQGAPFPSQLPPGMGASPLQGASFPPQLPGMGTSPLGIPHGINPAYLLNAANPMFQPGMQMFQDPQTRRLQLALALLNQQFYNQMRLGAVPYPGVNPYLAQPWLHQLGNNPLFGAATAGSTSPSSTDQGVPNLPTTSPSAGAVEASELESYLKGMYGEIEKAGFMKTDEDNFVPECASSPRAGSDNKECAGDTPMSSEAEVSSETDEIIREDERGTVKATEVKYKEDMTPSVIDSNEVDNVRSGNDISPKPSAVEYKRKDTENAMSSVIDANSNKVDGISSGNLKAKPSADKQQTNDVELLSPNATSAEYDGTLTTDQVTTRCENAVSTADDTYSETDSVTLPSITGSESDISDRAVPMHSKVDANNGFCREAFVMEGSAESMVDLVEEIPSGLMINSDSPIVPASPGCNGSSLMEVKVTLQTLLDENQRLQASMPPSQVDHTASGMYEDKDVNSLKEKIHEQQVAYQREVEIVSTRNDEYVLLYEREKLVAGYDSGLLKELDAELELGILENEVKLAKMENELLGLQHQLHSIQS